MAKRLKSLFPLLGIAVVLMAACGIFQTKKATPHPLAASVSKPKSPLLSAKGGGSLSPSNEQPAPSETQAQCAIHDSIFRSLGGHADHLSYSLPVCNLTMTAWRQFSGGGYPCVVTPLTRLTPTSYDLTVASYTYNPALQMGYQDVCLRGMVATPINFILQLQGQVGTAPPWSNPAYRGPHYGIRLDGHEVTVYPHGGDSPRSAALVATIGPFRFEVAGGGATYCGPMTSQYNGLSCAEEWMSTMLTAAHHDSPVPGAQAANFGCMQASSTAANPEPTCGAWWTYDGREYYSFTAYRGVQFAVEMLNAMRVVSMPTTPSS